MLEVINLGALEENGLSVIDFGRNWFYQRIIDPDGKPTNQWNLFLKGEHSSEFRVIKGVLSSEYSVLKTEDCVNGIQKALGGDKIGKPRVFANLSDLSASFLLKDFQMDIKEDDTTNKIMFGLLTDINIDEIDEKTALSFNVVNSLTGSRRITLSYGFFTNLIPLKDGERNRNINPLAINNTVLLNEFSTSLIHDKKLNITYQQVADVKSCIADKIASYKAIFIPKGFVAKMKKDNPTFPKKAMKRILSCWEEVDEEFRNFYYLSYVLSYTFGEARNIAFEATARKYISNAVDGIIKSMKQTHDNIVNKEEVVNG
jgi:hypothetical protein